LEEIDFSWRLKVDTLSMEWIWTYREFHVDGAETEKACEEKLLVMPDGLGRRFMLEERKDPDGK